MYVSEHPLADYQTELAQKVTSLAEVSALAAGQTVQIAGIVATLKSILTKSNQPMAFAQLEDMAGQGEVVIFPKTFQETKDLWVDGASLIVQGKTNDKDGETKILVDKVWQLTPENLAALGASGQKPMASKRQATPVAPTGITIRLPAHFTKESVGQLQAALKEQMAETGVPVELLLGANGTTQRVPTQFKIKPDATSLEAIKKVTGNQAVTLR